MSDLLRLLGREGLDRLSQAVGGTRLYIPRHYGKPPKGGRDTSVRLNALVGPEIAILLVFHFGDSVIYVPRLKPPTAVDPKQLKRLQRKGLSQRAIALTLGCSERAIELRQAKSKPNGKGKGIT